MVVDSSIFIDYLRAKNKEQTIFHKLPSQSEFFISPVTLYELYIGATSEKKWEDVVKLTEDIPVLGFTEQVAIRSAKIFHELKEANRLIEFRDIFIAATALTNDLPVLTLNRKDFRRIKNLILIDLNF